MELAARAPARVSDAPTHCGAGTGTGEDIEYFTVVFVRQHMRY